MGTARTVRLPPVASCAVTSASLPPSSVSFFLTNPPAALGSSLMVALRLRRPTRICQCWSTPACIDVVVYSHGKRIYNHTAGLLPSLNAIQVGSSTHTGIQKRRRQGVAPSQRERASRAVGDRIGGCEQEAPLELAVPRGSGRCRAELLSRSSCRSRPIDSRGPAASSPRPPSSCIIVSIVMVTTTSSLRLS